MNCSTQTNIGRFSFIGHIGFEEAERCGKRGIVEQYITSYNIILIGRDGKALSAEETKNQIHREKLGKNHVLDSQE